MYKIMIITKLTVTNNCQSLLNFYQCDDISPNLGKAPLAEQGQAQIQGQE